MLSACGSCRWTYGRSSQAVRRADRPWSERVPCGTHAALIIPGALDPGIKSSPPMQMLATEMARLKHSQEVAKVRLAV
jgi:hypothetical protein